MYDELCSRFSARDVIHDARTRTLFTTSGIWAKACCAICWCIASNVVSSILDLAGSSQIISYVARCTGLTSRHTIFIQVRLTEAANGQVKIDVFKVFVDPGLSSPISHPLFSHRRGALGGGGFRASCQQIRKVLSSRKVRSRERHHLSTVRPQFPSFRVYLLTCSGTEEFCRGGI